MPTRRLADIDVAGAARAARRAAAPHHVATAGASSRATRSPRIRATRATAASSSPTRSRAAPAAVLWEARRLPVGRGDGGRRNAGVDGLQARARLRSPIVIYGSPSRALWMIGVTGTNGKTSCAHWIAQALERCGRRAAVIGTLGNGFVGALEPAPNTTPDAAVLHEMLAQLAARRARRPSRWKCRRIGLDQGRVNGVDVRRRAVHEPDARPSRLSRDDGGVRRGEGAAVRVADAARGRDQRRRRVRPGPRSTSCARARAARARPTAVGAPTSRRRRSRSTRRRHRARRRDAVGRGRVATGVVGAFNASEPARRARRAARERRAARRRARGADRALAPPPGRMQRHRRRRQAAGRRRLRAHARRAREGADGAASGRSSTAASSSACSAAAAIAIRASGRRWARSPRALADRVVVTSDNPRSEDPAAIATRSSRACATPATGAGRVELDRAHAIRGAIAAAQAPATSCWSPARATRRTRRSRGERAPFSDAPRRADALAQWSGA